MLHHRLRSVGIVIPATPAADPDVRNPVGKPDPAKPGWEQFLVASKRVGDPWPAGRQGAILLARQRHDAGTHIMVSCTTANGWTQLYCRPRVVPVPATPFFKQASQP